MRRLGILSVALAVIAAAAILAGPARADEDKMPDATLTLSEGTVAAGVGWSWGHGELNFKGQTYKVKVDGLSVAEVGITKANATGSVYNLKSVDDFDGVYAAAGAEGTAGKGVGVS